MASKAPYIFLPVPKKPAKNTRMTPPPAAGSGYQNRGQYRTIEQERFASKFCALIRRGFAAILTYCKKSQRNQGAKFPQSAAASIVWCCPRHAPGFDEFALRILFYARCRAKEVKGARQRGELTIPFPQNYRKIARSGLVPRTGSGL